MSNLVYRVLTAFVFGVIALYLTWLGGTAFFLLAWCVGGFILYEWMNITQEKWCILQKILAGIFYFLIGFFLVLNISASLIFCVLIVLAAVLAIISIKNSGWVFCGFLYASFPVVALCFLRDHEMLGFQVVIFLFTIVWGTDIGGYFIGRALGGPKLAPQFSPNKTWSGALGGTFVGVFGGIWVAFGFFDINLASFFVPLLTLVLSIVSQLSDLGQSWLKRRFSVKDSGFLLPGHGGFMDRMDGLVGATCLLYLIGSLISDMNAPFNLFSMI
ncbi:phosphatidate cytidylyltransferase [Bartonella krasnovii]|uniref:Phosphatidate cytidylyltransferase n=1 Tax=Bartonella krasnovii TaxID=2267275 RepID=A0A5B9D0E3_9HYPH|nr:phosphatidate cytidylyltransferase [Bartonella krasnovii]QEE11976.1 phosphatidate cytidylyltransferase [Bartonella krasnovii]UNF29674.1 phosphatidate cytidylyltransferase [Bartonella krasnovii]UNF36035.1 phosphatidate cytidylyltransferase [Bartonella krasnovii]UNF37645.1 phosphatidate cytidylyltransferase [Bartonella krasnovii]UNF39429.1 phosphatidate cytidylyltransferase [Bartonella krasnovii]